MAEQNAAAAAVVKERVPAEFVTALLATRGPVDAAPAGRPPRLPAKLYGIMAAVALLTCVTLIQSYELLFTHPLYA